PEPNPSNPATRGFDVGPVLVTEEFGWRSGDAYLTGSVFRDDNHDQFYAPGEGLGGGGIPAVGPAGGGTFQAQTWASGGYSLRLPPGTYDVLASGPGLPFPRSTTVTIGVDNVPWEVPVGPDTRADAPASGHFDGEGQVDLALYQPSTSEFF